jgi:hypothetical protein
MKFCMVRFSKRDHLLTRSLLRNTENMNMAGGLKLKFILYLMKTKPRAVKDHAQALKFHLNNYFV